MSEPEPESQDELPAEVRGGFFINVVPGAMYVAAVFYGGSMGGPPVVGPDVQYADKWMHAAAFAGMQWVLRRAVAWAFPELEPIPLLQATLGLVVALGGLLEIYQMALPHRSAEWADWLADILGAALVFALQLRLAKSS